MLDTLIRYANLVTLSTFGLRGLLAEWGIDAWMLQTWRLPTPHQPL